MSRLRHRKIIYMSWTFKAHVYYKFDWAIIKDDYYNDFEHEAREGEKTTGSYWRVVLPNGRKQIVTYYVDGNSGYVAEVKYEGEAKVYDYKRAFGFKISPNTDF